MGIPTTARVRRRAFAVVAGLVCATLTAVPATGQSSAVEYTGAIDSADGQPIPGIVDNRVVFRVVEGAATGTIHLQVADGLSLLGEPESDLCFILDSSITSEQVPLSEADATGERGIDGTIDVRLTVIDGPCSAGGGQSQNVPSRLVATFTEREVTGTLDLNGSSLAFSAPATSSTGGGGSGGAGGSDDDPGGDGDDQDDASTGLEDVLSPDLIPIFRLSDIANASGCGAVVPCEAITRASRFHDEVRARFPDLFGENAPPNNQQILSALVSAEFLSNLRDAENVPLFPSLDQLRPVLFTLAGRGLTSDEARTAMLSLIRLAAGLDAEALR